MSEDYYVVKRNPNLIEIPEGATNGDMIKAMFPDAEIIFKDGTYETTVDWHTKTHRCHLFDNDWWSAPYRKEQPKQIAFDVGGHTYGVIGGDKIMKEFERKEQE